MVNKRRTGNWTEKLELGYRHSAPFEKVGQYKSANGGCTIRKPRVERLPTKITLPALKCMQGKKPGAF